MDAVNILLLEDEAGHIELMKRAFEQYPDRMRLDSRQQRRTSPRVLPAQPAGPRHRRLGATRRPRHGVSERTNWAPTVIPVVVMTSHGNEQVAVEAMKAGALDYVVKSPDTLADMPHIAERALREWGHIVERRRAEEERDRLLGQLARAEHSVCKCSSIRCQKAYLLLDARWS